LPGEVAELRVIEKRSSGCYRWTFSADTGRPRTNAKQLSNFVEAGAEFPSFMNPETYC
jgi:hypothetical protein